MGIKTEYKVICDNDDCDAYIELTSEDLDAEETIEHYLEKFDWIVEADDVVFCSEECQLAGNVDADFTQDIPVGFSWIDIEKNKCIVLDNEHYACFYVCFQEGCLGRWVIVDFKTLVSDYPKEVLHLKKCWDEHLEKKTKPVKQSIKSKRVAKRAVKKQKR